ncbi:ATP-binding protein [Candidatus Protochlamydia phocaeensis]|uniref:ATP-binding protein n=1 Tax=Candidatus Protochlamydia phocaeensis TaxID=1414722 RepID=UPI000837F438|nr:ATP-binding protein [Candidatus Protochlamydia phocaeensis]
MNTNPFKFTFLSWHAYPGQLKYYGLALIIFLLGCLLTFGAYRYYKLDDLNHLQSEFNRISDIRLYIIQEALEDTIEQMDYIKQFYYSSSEVNEHNFHYFVRNSLDLYPNLVEIGWFSSDNKEFPPWDQKTSLNFISFDEEAKRTNHFFPLNYLEISHSRNPLYIDIKFFSDFKYLLDHVADYSSVVISDTVAFFQDGFKQGFFLFDPIFSADYNSQGRPNKDSLLRGVLIGLSDFETIVQGIRTRIDSNGINIGIYDNHNGSRKLLYWNTGNNEKIEKPLAQWKQWTRSHTFNMGNRSWTIEATPTHYFFNQYKNTTHWEVPIIGLLLSGLTTFYFLVLVNQRLLIEQEVKKRTEELAEINRILQQEIHERQRIEEDWTKKQRYLQRRHEALEYLTKFTTSELKNAIHEVTLRTAAVMQVDRVSIWFYESKPQNEVLSCAGLYSFSTHSFSDHLELSSSYFPHYFTTLRKRSHLIIPSIDNPELNQELASYLATFHIISKLDIPIIFEGKLLGVLFCEETRDHRDWALEDRHFGQTIADIISIMIEQSARRKVEKALQESEERLRFITQKAIDAIISVSEKGEIMSWNYGAEQIFGYAEIEILGKPLSLILPHQSIQHFESTKSMEMGGKHKNGKNFPVEISHTRWQSGSLYFDTVIIRDITERKEYEQRLIKAMKEARAANQAKSEFLATISHELRTPLNAIIGFDQCLLMGMDGPINEQQQGSLKKIEKSSFHLLTLINDILDLAKIEANKMELEISPENIVEIINSCIEEIQPLAQQKQLAIKLFIGRPYILMEIDKIRVKQVLLNLLGNAVKFTESGFIQIVLINHPHSVEIQITDTGIGLTSEEIAKIFKPFSQADSSITRKFGGTGLGLAICKKIVDLHGGTLDVQSQKGKGSTFILILPKTQ